MIRDITIGQYYPSNSIIHRLDPRVKLMGTLTYVLSLFLFRGLAGFAAVTAGLAAVVKLSKVPFRYMVKGLKAIAAILAITVMFNLFLTPGEPLVSVWKLKITEEGLKSAGFMAVRLSYLILGSSVLTLATTPNQLTDGMEKSLRPFRRIGVPVHEVSMIMSIALRFIPILIEETDKIMKAQLARGAEKRRFYGGKAVLPDTGQLRAHTGYYAQPTDGRHGEIPAPLPQDRGPSP